MGNSYGDTLLVSFTSNINLGLRFASVIEVMKNPDVSENNFWSTYLYAMTHFIIINVILINILFGIIFDSFGKIR
jgi:hypothetical protein